MTTRQSNPTFFPRISPHDSPYFSEFAGCCSLLASGECPSSSHGFFLCGGASSAADFYQQILLVWSICRNLFANLACKSRAETCQEENHTDSYFRYSLACLHTPAYLSSPFLLKQSFSCCVLPNFLASLLILGGKRC